MKKFTKTPYTPKQIIHQKHLKCILEILNENGLSSMKDIRLALKQINHNAKSNTTWNLVNRLIKKGLIKKVENNRYKISNKGIKLLEIYNMEINVKNMYKTL